MRTKTIPANEVRIPEPEPGEVVVIERYGKPYAAVIDAGALDLFRRMLDVFGEHRPVELSLSNVALALHEMSEAGEDVGEFDFEAARDASRAVSAAGVGEPRGMRGAIVWAFTTFQPEAPFDLVGVDGVTRGYATASDVARAIKKREVASVPAFAARAKLRPVVLLQDRPLGVLPEYAALKLARLSKLRASDRQRVRDGEEPALFYLSPDTARYGLSQENAVDLNSLVRVHRSAFVTSPIGYLDADEIDVLGRRLAVFLDIDIERAIRDGVMAKLQEIAARQQATRDD